MWYKTVHFGNNFENLWGDMKNLQKPCTNLGPQAMYYWSTLPTLPAIYEKGIIH